MAASLQGAGTAYLEALEDVRKHGPLAVPMEDLYAARMADLIRKHKPEIVLAGAIVGEHVAVEDAHLDGHGVGPPAVNGDLETAAGADQGHHLARLDPEAHALMQPAAIQAGAQAFDLQGAHRLISGKATAKAALIRSEPGASTVLRLMAGLFEPLSVNVTYAPSA